MATNIQWSYFTKAWDSWFWVSVEQSFQLNPDATPAELGEAWFACGTCGFQGAGDEELQEHHKAQHPGVPPRLIAYLHSGIGATEKGLAPTGGLSIVQASDPGFDGKVSISADRPNVIEKDLGTRTPPGVLDRIEKIVRHGYQGQQRQNGRRPKQNGISEATAHRYESIAKDYYAFYGSAVVDRGSQREFCVKMKVSRPTLARALKHSANKKVS